MPLPTHFPRLSMPASMAWLACCLLALAGLAGCDDSPSDKLMYPDGGVIVRLPGVAQGGSEPILALTPDTQPVTPPAFRTVKRDFFECEGLVGSWYQKMVVAEMNHLAEMDGLWTAAKAAERA